MTTVYARRLFSVCYVATALGAGCAGADSSEARFDTFDGPGGIGAAGVGNFGNSAGSTVGSGGTTATGVDPATGQPLTDPSSPGFMGVGGSGGSGAAGSTPPAEPPPPPLPDEMEIALEFGLPQASEQYVYAVNPDGGSVAIIHAESLAIQVVEAGVRPTHLRTLAGTDDAIVLNLGSDDATIIRGAATGARTSSVAVVAGSNELAVAPDGKHAVAWFDATQPGATVDSGSFQSVSVIFLEAGADRVVNMTVGFRPRAVFFASDGTRAFVVTEDGISVLDFAVVGAAGSAIAPRISLGADLNQQSADVAVTPDGRWALARDLGASEIRLVDLRDGSVERLDLAGITGIAPGEGPAVEVTDLDLAPSGAFALAVMRNQRAVIRVDVPRGFNNPDGILIATIAGEIIGSATIAPTSDRALVYTTASEEERVTILDLAEGGSVRTVALRKTIEAVAIAPDGKTALLVHVKKSGSPDEPGIDPDVAIDRSYGYSVLGLESGQVKLQVTETPPGSFTLVPGHLFMLFRSDGLGVREVHQVSTTSFLVTPHELGSPPLSVGAVLSAERIFVNQEHPDGRITLIDWTTGEARTVTGYELNSTIRD